MKLKLKFFVCLFFQFSNTVFGQELKLVRNEFSNYVEEYSVLKSDKKLKHGKFVKSNAKGILKIGFYKNNLRDSTWTEYFAGTKQIENQGKFKNGLRIGPWEFFNSQGELVKKYDYSEDKLLFYKRDEKADNVFLAKRGSVFESLQLDRPPLFFPTKDGYVPDDRIKYPQQAMREGVTGTVLVSWVLDETGKMTDIKVEKGIGNGCDEEALRVVKEMNKHIILPGIFNGESVAVKYSVPIKFELQWNPASR